MEKIIFGSFSIMMFISTEGTVFQKKECREFVSDAMLNRSGNKKSKICPGICARWAKILDELEEQI